MEQQLLSELKLILRKGEHINKLRPSKSEQNFIKYFVNLLHFKEQTLYTSL